ncbi:uncharacterized protein YegJ (DUF2314 family) [Xanthomonas arboricola]|uniref:DUF2314 domain-containing protein n=1 Tax=Xanthomonas TaxID=338 RepID=UPI001621BE34|nr:DUF2314 domain-containing protein [Xanthomonas arboricola]MBB6336240.1 uncharacterized protein YegJ (DUF2314 family) [Xanthomonas arboricola]
MGKILGFVRGVLGIGQADATSKFEQPQDEPLFMAMPNGELADAARAANGSLGHFRQLLADGTPTDVSSMVKTRISDPASGVMWLWLTVDSATPSGFNASVFEAPPEFTDLSPGTRKFVPESEVADWALVSSGVMQGGYSLRIQRSRLPAAEREPFDRYIGVSSYAPLPAPNNSSKPTPLRGAA